MTLRETLKTYEKLAIDNNKEGEAVKLLIMELSLLTPTQFYLNQNEQVSEPVLKLIDQAVKKYVFEDVPIQHILGFSYFYGYRFKVNEDVLIPRRETEELVEEVLMIYDEYFNGNEVEVIDLGTGSGCISVTLSVEEDKMKIDAVDLSEAALKVAKENNQTLGGTVNFFQSDWFKNVKKTYDIIVANPPYIPNGEAVEAIVKKEPSLALYGGIDGLEPYEIILRNAKNHLKKKALIAFEHGYQHKDAIRAIALNYFPDAVIYQKKDLQGKDRMTFVGIGGVLKNE
ncbi:peptide chain release factor N(5)-glutamine methyltransferase [Acholeplasma equirhinis]|uniref:peptide chain release factor N(5)-glutamine methyltransferase n=1 Tax=Acholeplasma equirhinis TaxID=555393 RepID=UPI00197A75A4|nr:peptide chain release factor N(5)-glutamine methyltransferase [Acholeplasma equirhinis]MBN3490850.1 peptide chain release factor N(5)-glutamine methyltransferase [Acholeplasma equirhinis]